MEKKKNRGARTLQAQARAAGAACNSVVSSGVCRRCSGGGRDPGLRLVRPDVHGHGPGWVWLGVSLLLELAG